MICILYRLPAGSFCSANYRSVGSGEAQAVQVDARTPIQLENHLRPTEVALQFSAAAADSRFSCNLRGGSENLE